MHNRRSQRRLHVGISISVIPADSSQLIVVDNQDLSWSGTRFVTRDPDVYLGKKLQLIFPWRKGESFVANADVIRREPLEDGRIKVAARFSCLSRVDQARLAKILRLLSEHEQQAFDDRTPIVEHLEINVTDEREMHDTLMQIANGRLLLTVFGGYRVDQSILLSITGEQIFPQIHLRARVQAQESLSFPSNHQSDLVKLDLKFEHPSQDLIHLTHLLLRVLTGSSRDHSRS
jgi:hypothetical protein